MRAAEAGSGLAHVKVACMYEEGRGTELSVVKALQHYLIAHEKGVALAAGKIERLCLMEAAKVGNMDAQVTLAEMYLEGREVVKSVEKAIELLTSAAEKGHGKASYLIGKMYEAGEYLEQSNSDAFLCYEKAANEDLCDAQYRLGHLYQAGKGVWPSKRQAIKYYRLAADQGLIEAQIALALLDLKSSK